MLNKSNKKSANAPASEYNGWRVLAIFIQGVFNLINNNKIYPAFGLLLLGIAAIVVFRLPDTELAPLVKLLIESLTFTSKGLLGLLVVTNAGWAVIIVQSRNIYKAEISRLAAIRHELITGNPGRVVEHQSSDHATNEAYIFPHDSVKQ